MFLYYFEQVTTHSIRTMFSLCQHKNILTFISTGNRIFKGKRAGQLLCCVNHNCNGRMGSAATVQNAGQSYSWGSFRATQFLPQRVYLKSTSLY